MHIIFVGVIGLNRKRRRILRFLRCIKFVFSSRHQVSFHIIEFVVYMLLIFLMVVIKNMKIASFIKKIEMCRCFVVDN